MIGHLIRSGGEGQRLLLNQAIRPFSLLHNPQLLLAEVFFRLLAEVLRPPRTKLASLHVLQAYGLNAVCGLRARTQGAPDQSIWLFGPLRLGDDMQQNKVPAILRF